MKLRIIIIVLALLSFFSTTLGGYLYYSSLKDRIISETHHLAEARTDNIAEHVNDHIIERLEPSEKLAEYEIFETALKNGSTLAEQADANALLKHIKDSMDADIAYLMNLDGKVIASSNFDSPDSLVGNNYGFRPYFLNALQGDPAIYLALGVTTNKRGIYFGLPVSEKTAGEKLGVIVFKLATDFMESELHDPDLYGVLTLVSPNGVIFSSSREDWLYNALWDISPEKRHEIALSRQFGKGPWQWTGLTKKKRLLAEDRSGRRFLIHQQDIDILPGWQVVFLHDLDLLADSVRTPQLKVIGQIIAILSILVGIGVVVLYRRASDDIIKRKMAEKEKEKLIEDLRKALGEIKTLQGVLPICSFCKKIRDDEGAWNQMESYIHDHSGVDFSHGICPDCLRKEYPDIADEVIGDEDGS